MIHLAVRGPYLRRPGRGHHDCIRDASGIAFAVDRKSALQRDWRHAARSYTVSAACAHFGCFSPAISSVEDAPRCCVASFRA
jgi:hypothetical protein